MKPFLTARRLAPVLSLMALLSVGSLSQGCASTREHDSTGEYVDDTGITTRVKTAFLRDEMIKSFEIKVETMKGVVQLSGFVDNYDQKAAAGRDAAAVNGVADVHNNLIVK